MRVLQQIGQCILAIALSLAAGTLGSLATVPNIPTWYAALDRPPLLPPNEVFGPVWSVLYVMMGVSLFLVWRSRAAKSKKIYVAYGVQLILNTVWSLVFFGLHQPWAGVVVIVALMAAIVWTMREFTKVSKAAVWLLVPYLLWVLFATYLTIGVAVLN